MSIISGEKVRAIQTVVKGLKEGKIMVSRVTKYGRGKHKYPYVNLPELLIKTLELRHGNKLTVYMGPGYVEYKLGGRGDFKIVKGNSRGTTLRVRFPIDYEGPVIIEVVDGGFRVYYS